MEKTEVIFRKERDGEILAIFPYEIASPDYDASCYMRIGQHSACDYAHCMKTTTPASPEEYAPLLGELRSIGYEPTIILKRSRRKFNQKNQ